MEFDQGWTTLEAIGVAIKSEIDSKTLYEKAFHRVKNSILKDKLKFLMGEEEKHRKILEKMHKELFPDQEIKHPETEILPKIKKAIEEEISVSELFQIAMENERVSENFYRNAADKSNNPSSKSIFLYLSEVENGHYHLLKGEVQLIEKYEDYPDEDTWKLIHTGV